MKAFTKKLFLMAMAVILLILNGCGDVCDDVACLNGGACQDGTCICPDGFTGENCQSMIDPCINITCMNDGICVDGTCECPLFYDGDFCENEAREKYLGTYFGTLEASGYTSERYFTLLNDGTGIEYIKFGDLRIILTSNAEFSFESITYYDTDFEWVVIGGYGEFLDDSIQGELVYSQYGNVVVVLEMNLLKQ